MPDFSRILFDLGVGGSGGLNRFTLEKLKQEAEARKFAQEKAVLDSQNQAALQRVNRQGEIQSGIAGADRINRANIANMEEEGKNTRFLSDLLNDFNIAQMQESGKNTRLITEERGRDFRALVPNASSLSETDYPVLSRLLSPERAQLLTAMAPIARSVKENSAIRGLATGLALSSGKEVMESVKRQLQATRIRELVFEKQGEPGYFEQNFPQLAQFLGAGKNRYNSPDEVPINIVTTIQSSLADPDNPLSEGLLTDEDHKKMTRAGAEAAGEVFKIFGAQDTIRPEDIAVDLISQFEPTPEDLQEVTNSPDISGIPEALPDDLEKFVLQQASPSPRISDEAYQDLIRSRIRNYMSQGATPQQILKAPEMVLQ